MGRSSNFKTLFIYALALAFGISLASAKHDPLTNRFPAGVSTPIGDVPLIPNPASAAADSVPKDDGVPRNYCDPTLLTTFYASYTNRICRHSSAASCSKSFINGPGKEVLNQFESFAGGFLAYEAATVWTKRTQAAAEAEKKQEELIEHLRDAAKKGGSTIDDAVYNGNSLKGVLESEYIAKDEFKVAVKAYLAANPEDAIAKGTLAALEEVGAKLLTRQVLAKTLIIATVGTGVTKANVIAGPFIDAYFNNLDCGVMNDQFTSRDEKCKPVYELSQAVLDFLRLPHSQKMKLLAERPALCKYYEDFNKDLKKKITPDRIANITCGGDQFSYDLREAASNILPDAPIRKDSLRSYHVVIQDNLDGTMKSLTAQLNTGQHATTGWPNHFNIDYVSDGRVSVIRQANYHEYDALHEEKKKVKSATWQQIVGDADFEEGYVKHSYFETFRRTTESSKLYGDIIKFCCSHTDTTKRSTCLGAIEKPPADKGSLDEIENNARTQTDPPPPNSNVAPAAK